MQIFQSHGAFINLTITQIGEGGQILLVFRVVTKWIIRKVDTFAQHSFANQHRRFIILNAGKRSTK